MIARKVLLWLAGLLAAAGGIGVLVFRASSPASGPACAGYAVPPANPHPTVSLASAEFQPPALKRHETAVIKAYTNGPTDECEVSVILSPHGYSGEPGSGGYVQVEVRLRDDGAGGDAQANDGEWYGEWPVGESPPPPYSVSPMVYARFTSTDSEGRPYDRQGIELPEVRIVAADAAVDDEGEDGAREAVGADGE